jgi:hypothetical protein
MFNSTTSLVSMVASMSETDASRSTALEWSLRGTVDGSCGQQNWHALGDDDSVFGVCGRCAIGGAHRPTIRIKELPTSSC